MTHAVTVLDRRVYGPIVPRELQEACRRLSALIGVPLLQVLLRQEQGGEWHFVDATAAVDFRLGGTALVRDIASTLRP